MWRIFFDGNTGQLKSIASVWGDNPNNWDFIELEQEPDLSTLMWEETTRQFIVRPPKVFRDRLQDLMDDPRFEIFRTQVWQQLDANGQNVLRQAIIILLGKARWRNQTETVVVEPED